MFWPSALYPIRVTAGAEVMDSPTHMTTANRTPGTTATPKLERMPYPITTVKSKVEEKSGHPFPQLKSRCPLCTMESASFRTSQLQTP